MAKKTVKKTKTASEKAEKKTATPKKPMPEKAAVKKALPKKAAVPAKAEPKLKAKAEPKEKCIFKAIENCDLESFTALLPTQKNKRGEYGRTPLMVVNLIRSNTRMTDGSNFETKRNTKGKATYDEMFRLLVEAGADRNAMDDGGNTVRDYANAGIQNTVLAD